jgi:hypothetical protein
VAKKQGARSKTVSTTEDNLMRRVYVVLFLLLVSTLTAVAKKPKLEYDKTIDFTAYKTYAWVQGIPSPRPFVNTCIVGAINEELKRVGLAEVVPEKADLLITYFGISKENVASAMSYWPSVSTTTVTISGGESTTSTTNSMWRTGLPGPPTNSYFRSGSFIVAISDNKQQKLIWRSVVKTVVEENNKLIQQINSTVEDMFKDFPPKGK